MTFEEADDLVREFLKTLPYGLWYYAPWEHGPRSEFIPDGERGVSRDTFAAVITLLEPRGRNGKRGAYLMMIPKDFSPANLMDEAAKAIKVIRGKVYGMETVNG